MSVDHYAIVKALVHAEAYRGGRPAANRSSAQNPPTSDECADSSTRTPARRRPLDAFANQLLSVLF